MVTNSEIFQTVLMVWGVSYAYAFAVGMFRFARRERQAPFFARLAVCFASAILGPIFVVLDLVDLIRRNLRRSVRTIVVVFITMISFIGNMLIDMVIKVFVILFSLVFIFFPARKR